TRLDFRGVLFLSDYEIIVVIDEPVPAVRPRLTGTVRFFTAARGDVVAVTSIIAVVSLIQGLNASVKSAILNQAGADSFNIQQFPITRSDEDFEKVRSNPRITQLDARAIRRYSPLATAVMLDSGASGR